MFVGRNPDNSIYGLWTVRQWAGQEELPDNDPAVVAFVNRPKLSTSRLSVDDLAAALQAKGVLTAADLTAAVKTAS